MNWISSLELDISPETQSPSPLPEYRRMLMLPDKDFDLFVRDLSGNRTTTGWMHCLVPGQRKRFCDPFPVPLRAISFQKELVHFFVFFSSVLKPPSNGTRWWDAQTKMSGNADSICFNHFPLSLQAPSPTQCWFLFLWGYLLSDFLLSLHSPPFTENCLFLFCCRHHLPHSGSSCRHLLSHKADSFSSSTAGGISTTTLVDAWLAFLLFWCR